MTMNAKLTPKQAAFVGEYLVDLNATQAAIRAGYSKRAARQMADENMSKPAIAEAIAAAKFERSRRTKISSDRVLQELACIAFFDIAKAFTPDGGLLPLDQMDEDTRRVLAGLEVNELFADGKHIGNLKKVKIADKLVALDKLARHLGLLSDRITVAGDPEKPLTMLLKRIQGTALRVAHEGDEDAECRRAA